MLQQTLKHFLLSPVILGLYRLPSVSILSSQVVTSDRPVSLLDHKGCPQTLVYDTSLNSDTRGHPDVAKSKFLFTKEKEHKEHKPQLGELIGRSKRAQHFWAKSQCFSILMVKVFSNICNQFPGTPVRTASCSLMVVFLEKSDSSTNHLRSWTFPSLLIPVLTFGGQCWTQG